MALHNQPAGTLRALQTLSFNLGCRLLLERNAQRTTCETGIKSAAYQPAPSSGCPNQGPLMIVSCMMCLLTACQVPSRLSCSIFAWSYIISRLQRLPDVETRVVERIVYGSRLGDWGHKGIDYLSLLNRRSRQKVRNYSVGKKYIYYRTYHQSRRCREISGGGHASLLRFLTTCITRHQRPHEISCHLVGFHGGVALRVKTTASQDVASRVDRRDRRHTTQQQFITSHNSLV